MPKTKMVIVEGVDSVGKTTFIKSLGDRYIHFPELKTIRPAAHFISPIVSIFERLDPEFVYVLDRFAISDIIYNDVIRHWNGDSFRTALVNMAERLDLVVVILNGIEREGQYRDEKIVISGGQYNDLVKAYIDFSEPGVEIMRYYGEPSDVRNEIAKKDLNRHFKI